MEPRKTFKDCLLEGGVNGKYFASNADPSWSGGYL